MAKKRKSIDAYKQDVRDGNYLSFLNSAWWQDKRAYILLRDKHRCQRCLGKYVGKFGGKPKYIRITKAEVVHHHEAAEDNVDRILDDDNLVSLCWLCHEIVEGRVSEGKFGTRKKKPVTKEQW